MRNNLPKRMPKRRRNNKEEEDINNDDENEGEEDDDDDEDDIDDIDDEDGEGNGSSTLKQKKTSKVASSISPAPHLKGSLINVRVFKQSIEKCLMQEQQIVKEEQYELTDLAQKIQQGYMTNGNTYNNVSNDVHVGYGTLHDAVSRPIASQTTVETTKNSHFKDSIQFLLKPEHMKALDTSELLLPEPFDMIEGAIIVQLEKTKHLDEGFNGNPSEIIQSTGLDFNEITTISQIEASQRTELFSLTEIGKQENGLMLPRKEMNYVTPSMQQTGKLKHIHRPVLQNEVILKVALYHSEKNQKTQEFAVLGSQKLTDLRDCFYCLSDHIINGKNTPSGYFFIENVFYNDLRDSKAIDYSKNVIQWVMEEERWKQPGLAKYTAKKMEETTFYDLSIRIGERYLYCHQGDCKHFIIFTDLRLVNEEDHQNFNSYPIRVFQSKVRRRKCCICEIYPAKYVTYKDKYSSEEPAFYCDCCYRQFHYNSEGKLLYDDFQVYRYYHE